MPHIVRSTEPGPFGGAILDLFVGISDARNKALQKENKEGPGPVVARALIDTGASCTCIDPGILQRLALTPTGSTSVHTPSTGPAPHNANMFDVTIYLYHDERRYMFQQAVPVVESPLAQMKIDVLLGRDILEKCLFILDGQEGTYTLAF